MGRLMSESAVPDGQCGSEARATNSHAERSACAGMLQWRPRWGLTVRGWLLSAMVIALLMLAALMSIHPFLAARDPAVGSLLVIEGWIPDYALKECADLVRSNNYVQLYTVGGPVGAADYPAAEDDTYAYTAQRYLQKHGVDPKRVERVPTNLQTFDRTFSSAIAMREYLKSKGPLPPTITVATLGAHARRTRMLYQRAFGRGTQVGVFALDNREYDPAHWWRFSEGIREVVSEGAAYIAAKFLPHSEKEKRDNLTNEQPH
jgi:hypothetical protein